MTLARIALDSTAVAAYCSGSPDVGELLGELADEQVRFAIPAVCLAEAGQTLADDAWPLLDVLAGLPNAVVLPLEAED